MSSNWEKVRLGDVCEVIGGYAFKKNDFTSIGVPVIKIKNIKPPIIDYTDVEYVSIDMLKTKEKFLLTYNDILISLTGSSLSQINSLVGKVGRVKTEHHLMLNQRVGKFNILDSQRLNQDFLYYKMSMFDTQLELALGATGSANQANISPSQIENLEINLPPLETQEKIANILSALDDKIENNKRTAEKLEEVAQTLFKQWFVDFNFPNEDGKPYKDNGGEMVRIELGEIPKGAKLISITEMAEFINGLALKRFPPNKDEKPLRVLKIRELRQGFCDDSSDVATNNVDDKYIIKENDLIFSWSGSLLVDFWYDEKCFLNQHLFNVLPKGDFNKEFVYLVLNHFVKRFIHIAEAKQTTMGHIKRSDLENAILPIISNKKLKEFQQIIIPLINNLNNLFIENRQLQKLRDTLLPKLMSGEIEV